MTTLIPYQIPIFEYLSRCSEEYVLGLGRFLWLLEQEYDLNTVLYTFETSEEGSDDVTGISLGVAIDSKNKSEHPDPFFKALKNVAYACNCPDIAIIWYNEGEELQ
jgi:hypothetical protein